MMKYQFIILVVFITIISTGANEWKNQLGIKTLAQNYYQLKPFNVEIARLITVRILSNRGAGSGIIIEHQGETYTVLTCDHVGNVSPNDSFSILTSDSKTHQGYRKRLLSLENVDLALIQFKSLTSYQVAVAETSQNISVGDTVYTSGFSNYQYHNSTPIGETFHWGLKAYKLTTGKISLMLTNQSLPRGYKLGYTNDVESGMSGGPVLNNQGRLIGINGRAKYPLQGIDAFVFADGIKPSQDMFKHMESLSWGIPISIYQQKIGQLQPKTQLNYR